MGTKFFLSKLQHKIFRGSFSKDASTLTFMQVVMQIVNFAIMTRVTRHLGVSDVGHLNFMQTFVSYVFMCNAAFDSYFMWRVANDPKSLQENINGIFVTKIVVNFITLLIGFCFVPHFFTASEFPAVIAVLLFGLAANSVGFYPLFMYATRNISVYVKYGLRSFVVFTILRVAGLVFGMSWEYFAVIVPLEAIILAMVLVGSGVMRPPSKFSVSRVYKQLTVSFKEAYYHVGVVFLSMVFTRIDQFVVKASVGSVEFGLYSSAIKLVEYPSVVGTVLLNSFMPRISAANEVRTRRLMAKIGIAMFFGLGLFISFCLVFAAPYIGELILGKGFAGVASYLKIYAWSLPFVWVYYFVSSIFASSNMMRYSFVITLIGAVSSCILLYSLVPIYGVIGAAWSLLFSQVIVAVASLLWMAYKWRVLLNNTTGK